MIIGKLTKVDVPLKSSLALRSNFTHLFLCFLKALRFSSVLSLLYLLRSLVHCMFSLRRALVIKGPSFARLYFLLTGAYSFRAAMTTAVEAP